MMHDHEHDIIFVTLSSLPDPTLSLNPARGVRRKEPELRNSRTSGSFRQFRAHRQMRHGHLSSHGLTYFWSSRRFRTAASQRAFSVGTRGRGDCFARRDKCPPGGCPRRHPAVRRAASTPRVVGVCGTHCGGTLSQRSREADRGVALGWPRRGCYVVHDGVVAARAGDGRRAGRRRRGRPARGRARGARAARRELGVLRGRRGGWQECERVSRRQRQMARSRARYDARARLRLVKIPQHSYSAKPRTRTSAHSRGRLHRTHSGQTRVCRLAVYRVHKYRLSIDQSGTIHHYEQNWRETCKKIQPIKSQ